jgi:2,4-dienoyl-CoA reductase-like NADH-dependent reductase (Old Yellow Enzyme family)
MLLHRIERYLRSTKMTATRFGRDAVGDPNFVTNLRDGRQPRQTTLTRVLDFIERAETPEQ